MGLQFWVYQWGVVWRCRKAPPELSPEEGEDFMLERGCSGTKQSHTAIPQITPEANGSFPSVMGAHNSFRWGDRA